MITEWGNRPEGERITVASIQRRIEKYNIGVVILDEQEWAFVLEKILPRVGATVLIKNLPKKIEDVLRIKRGEGGITTTLQYAAISGKFRSATKHHEAAVRRFSR